MKTFTESVEWETVEFFPMGAFVINGKAYGAYRGCLISLVSDVTRGPCCGQPDPVNGLAGPFTCWTCKSGLTLGYWLSSEDNAQAYMEEVLTSEGLDPLMSTLQAAFAHEVIQEERKKLRAMIDEGLVDSSCWQV